MKRLFTLLLALCLLLPAALAESIGGTLVINAGSADKPDYRVVAAVIPPEGYVPMESVTPNSETEPEYYFAPEDASNPVRFFYYTTGYGDARTLAERAVESYATFYEDFSAGEVSEIVLAEKNCLSFSYTCSYAGQDGVTPVYEQSALCYFPVKDNAFIACILSLSFDSAEDYLDADALNALLEQAAASIHMAK